MNWSENVIRLDEVDSTNEYAKRIADRSEDGTIIIAETQTQGKGRLNRYWYSPRGGIWMSIILKSIRESPYAQLLTLFTGVAVIQALKSLGLQVSLKWPNDIIANNKKLGGILTEWEPTSGSVIIGIGLNLNIDPQTFPPELQHTATSVLHELKSEIDKDGLVNTILKEFQTVYAKFENGQIEELLLAWKHNSNILGRDVVVETVGQQYQGRAIDVDQDGSLILKEKSGKEQKIVAGDVKFLE
ncbi:MAG: biotin--[acetyl-CoA-carboxylase] ligase [candidate division WOR-3 bacterium]